MLRWIATGAAALGLIGGAGAVVYNGDGSATVKIKGDDGVTHTTTLPTDSNGPDYWCDDTASKHLKEYDVELGRIKVTQEAHPERYNDLVDEFNRLNAERNQVLETECQR